MTGPTPNRRRRRADSRENTALYEEMKRIVDQLKSASEMMTQMTQGMSGTGERQGPWARDSTLQVTNQLLESMNPGTTGPVIAGRVTPGPNMGRPSMYNRPQGPGHPGTPGHGGGGGRDENDPYRGGSRASGWRGMLQNTAASYMHNRFGLGEGTYTRDAANNQWIVQHPNGDIRRIDDQEYARRMQRSNQAGNIAGSTGGLADMMGNVPIVGQVAQLGNDAMKLGNFIGDQNAANLQYTSIYGPGSNGFDQRVHNFGGRIRNTMRNIGSVLGLSDAGLSDSDYDKTFKGISAMGYSGGTRNRMLNFANTNMNTMGMSVDESLQVIGINAKTTSTSLSELGQHLRQVSEMARETGQNADVFRQKFIQSYGTAVNSGFGASSGIMAQTNTAATVGMGRQYAGMNFSSMYSSINGQQVLASASGYASVAQFDFAARQNPMVTAKAQQSLVNAQLGQVATAEATQYARELIKASGGNVATDQNRALSIANQVIQRYPSGVQPYAIANGLQAIGITGVDTNNVPAMVAYWVQWLASNGTNITGPTAQQMAKNDQQTGSKGAASARQRIASDIKNDRSAGAGIAVGKDSKGGLTFDPVIANAQDAGVNQVQVETKDGPAVVSLNDAAKNYRDQLTNGTAVIMNGQNAGSTIGDVYGTEQSAKYGDTSNRKAKGPSTFSAKDYKRLQEAGVTAEQMQQLAGMKNSDDMGTKALYGIAMKDPSTIQSILGQKSGNGSVTVKLQPGLEKYFQLVDPSGIVDGAANSGSAPSIPSSGSSTSGRGGR